MWYSHQRKTQRAGSPSVRRSQHRLHLEVLEDRSLPNNLLGLLDALPEGVLGDLRQDLSSVALLQEQHTSLPQQSWTPAALGDATKAMPGLADSVPTPASGTGSGSSFNEHRSSTAAPVSSSASGLLGDSPLDQVMNGLAVQRASQLGHQPMGDAIGLGGSSSPTQGPGIGGQGFGPLTAVNSSVITSLGAGADQANALAIQGDGKIVAAGFANGGILTGQFAVVRYNSDLTQDTSFGVSGIRTTTISGHGDEANAMAIQSDGKIVLAGYANAIVVQGVYYPNFAVARYNTNGSLDTSFNGKGFTTTNVLPGTKKVAYGSVARAVAIDSSGRIVVAGGTNSEFAVARYTSSGALDTTFNSTGSLPGTIITPIPGGNATAYSAIVQADGKILIGGNAGSLFTFVRYNSNGTLDSTFGTGGIVIEPSMGVPNHNAFRAMTLDANGNIVAVGQGLVANTGAFALIARFSPTGALDTTFNGTGYAITDLSSVNSGNSQGQAVNIQSDGKLLLSGWAVLADNGAYNQNFAAARYNTDGTLDSTFNSTGIVTYVFASSPFSNDVAYGAGLASNGNLIMAGFTSAPPAGQSASGNNFGLVGVTP